MHAAWLKASGIDLPAAAEACLDAFVRALLDENRRLNLTAAREEAALWRHVGDSLALLRVPDVTHSRHVLDLGSGGGLPGLPLACACSHLQITLLDATRKKVGAVQRIATRLGLTNVTTQWGRAETLAHDPTHRERFDLVTARAVAALPTLVEYAAGFARAGGVIWLHKSRQALGEESATAAPILAACHLAPLDPVAYRLAGDTSDRFLLGYRKDAPLPADWPRAAGRAGTLPA